MSTFISKDRTKLFIQTAQEARELDTATINQVPVPGHTLMEVAGSKAADILRKTCEPNSSLLFLCGSGNNTGDALVIARHLADQFDCSLLMLRDKEDLSEDARLNFDRLTTVFPDITIHTATSVLSDLSFDWIIDGLLGTGLSSEVRSPYDEVIDLVNQSDSSVAALDIPSGLNATTGEIMGTAIKADLTCTFGHPKTGCYFGAGRTLCGDIYPINLGFPGAFNPCKRFSLNESASPGRLDGTGIHKYKNGVVYILGGSPGLTGAVVHAARAAWKLGIGSVCVIAPRGLMTVFDNLLPEVVKFYVGEREDYIFTEQHVAQAISYTSHHGVCLTGPGMGTDDMTKAFLNGYLRDLPTDYPCVIDADGLRLVDHSLLHKSKRSFILTPHPGELRALSQSQESWETEYDRMLKAEEIAEHHELTLVSKGLPTIVTTPCETHIATYSHDGFNRIGFGDILSGATAAFRTQFNDTDAARYALQTSYNWMNSATALTDTPGPEDLLNV